jgi:hypothetical protein
MSPFVWILLGLAVWAALGVVVAVAVGRMVRRRDAQVPHDSAPAPSGSGQDVPGHPPGPRDGLPSLEGSTGRSPGGAPRD